MRLKRILCLNRLAAAALVGAATIVATAGSASAEDKMVKRAELIVREGKGSVYKPIATLRRGDVVNVVGKDDTNPRWLKVDVNGQTGWVYEDALEARSVTAGQGGRGGMGGSVAVGEKSAASMGAGFGAGVGEVALAGSGWEARQYAQKKNLNAAGLQTLMNNRRSITGAELDAFQSQGKVGAAGGR